MNTDTNLDNLNTENKTNKFRFHLPRRVVDVEDFDQTPPTECYTNPQKKTNNSIRIATLNVRSLQNEDQLQELEHAIEKINWDVLGLSEIRRNYESITERNSDILICHTAAKKGKFGVGFCIKKKWKKNLEEFKPINERIATLSLRISPTFKLQLVQVHAPTSEATQEEIECFYNKLDNIIDESKGKTKHIIVMGDFNAKIGQKQLNEDMMGNANYGCRNDRGEVLINFAAQHQLKIGNSFFNRKKERKWTWKSPTGYKNEIDFILTTNAIQLTNVDIISYLEFNTDHRLVRATIKIDKKDIRKKAFRTTPSQKTIKENEIRYLESLRNSLNHARYATEDMSSQELYDLIESAITNTTEDMEPGAMTSIANRFSDETKALMKRRGILEKIKSKSTRQRIELAETRKLIRKYIRKDRHRREEQMAQEILEDSGSFKKVKRALNKGKQWIQKLTDSTGKISYRRSTMMETATKFYEDLYSDNKYVAENTCSRTVESVPDFMKEEITKAIKELKNNRSPGEDRILNEHLKIGQAELVKPLQILFNKILQSENIPKQWTKSQIILLFKKGDRSNINNYRPISLLPSIYKIFSKLIQQRIQKKMEEFQPEEQAGFRKNYSTVDHLHTLNQLLEKSNEYVSKLYVAFIDYNKAFDSLKHEYIWEALENAGVEMKYVSLIKNIYKENTACLRMDRQGDQFCVKRGVRQGDPLSPCLFTCVLQTIFQKLDWENKKLGCKINGTWLTNLRFADDIVIFAETADELKQQLIDLNDLSKKVGLTMNFTKTKLMTNHTRQEIKVDNLSLDYVDDYIYLGQTVSFKDRLDKEIQRRITAGWKKFWSLKEIIKSKMPMYIKRRTFDTCISPVLTYGCQTWAMTKKQIRKLRTCQNKMERSLLEIKQKDKIPIKEIKRRTKITDITKTIKQLKWSWAGHVMRNKNGWSKEITEWLPMHRKRRRGRQFKRWSDELKDTAGKLWMRKAKDREEWKLMGEAFAQKWAQP